MDSEITQSIWIRISRCCHSFVVVVADERLFAPSSLHYSIVLACNHVGDNSLFSLFTMARSSAEGNANVAIQATEFAKLFFTRQEKDKENISDLYHNQSTLIWNGEVVKSKTNIHKFHAKLQIQEITVECLDVQIMPQLGDMTDTITILAGGKLKQNDTTSNFSRTFLIGPSIQGKSDILIISDTMRTVH